MTQREMIQALAEFLHTRFTTGGTDMAKLKAVLDACHSEIHHPVQPVIEKAEDA